MKLLFAWLSLEHAVPAVDGQGNFGSIEETPRGPSIYRSPDDALCQDLLADLEMETVEFEDNYDETLTMPSVLPTRVPNLLVNGSTGIAVGMATNIPRIICARWLMAA
ncbi:MAG: hypothetical protein CM1200mP9_00450 [Gammaproteobacteria bacterium]|nr:MAG: hypothetical protein CM1200mP9_00450 [Gammaproteobacteria bacterium]